LSLLVLVVWLNPLPLSAQKSAPASHPSASVQAHFAAAQKAQAENDYATAEREYSSVVAIVPNFAEAHMNLGLVFQLQHRLPEAMAEFSRALKIKPSLEGANFFLGVDYCNAGKGTRAIPYLKTAVSEDANRVDPWSWLATAQELAGELPAEVVTLNRALKLHPQNMDLLYQLGHVYERLGKQQADALGKMHADSFRSEQLLAESYASSSEWPSAVIHFENAIASSPETRGLHLELGEVLLQAGKLKRAVEEFDTELTINPHSLRALVRRGEVRLAEAKVDGSLEDWSLAIEIDQQRTKQILGLQSGLTDLSVEQLPEELRSKLGETETKLRGSDSQAARLAVAFLESQAHASQQSSSEPAEASTNNIGTTHCSEAAVRHDLEEERFTSVAECATQVLTATSPSEFRIRVAAASLETGHYDTALSALLGLPKDVRQRPEASYWLARCYGKLAVNAYLQLCQTNPNSYRAHQLLGDLDAAKEEDKDAMVEYRTAIELRTTLPNLHYDLGHLLWKHLATDEARRELEAELALNPNHAGALNDLGDTYLLNQQPEKALIYLNRALALDPDNPQIHSDLGTAYSQLGDYGKASTELLIALPEDRDGSIHFKLGRAYRALGQKDKAKREFAVSEVLSRESHSKLEQQTQRLAEMSKW
jgi:tetratricopeptide (TPR) repeat protein